MLHHSISPGTIQPRIVSKPWRLHTDHAQTPRWYVLELRAKDDQVDVNELVP